MPKRKRKNYSRPKKLYDKVRIKEEDELVKKYGLKNKKEIWKAEFAITKMRNLAKKLITASKEEQEKFIEKQKANGFDFAEIADVLGLDKEDYLRRRLQSIVVKKGLARTPRQARQFISHRHIVIEGNVISSPGHLTTLEEEQGVDLVLKKPAKKAELKPEEKKIVEEIKEIKEEQKQEATEETKEETKEEVKEEAK
jgi:small subunit ribosomal protein S4